jgi:hypothetical protein
VLGLGGLVPAARAEGPDKSEVVLVLDMSASILRDSTNRNRFGVALDRIAARVDEIASDLTAGDTTVSIVRFAARAADVPGCVGLKLLDSPAAVGKFADCLRSVARNYKTGGTAALARQIGVDTNYVAAMTLAAKHLPNDAVRPAVVLFTDGRHDVAGVPASRVVPARNQLFAKFPTFALLPVGMGLAAKDRAALTTGLESLRQIRSMPACVSGATFDWPQVVFQTADQAGNAVAVALQDATCTFTAAPEPTPSPTPTPQLAPIAGVGVTAGDGQVQLTWTKATGTGADAVKDYKARCRAGDGDWIESTDGVSLDPTATVSGLENGTVYTCQVGQAGADGTFEWTPAGQVTPLGKPAAPAKPIVTALDQAADVSVTANSLGVTRYQIECSTDGGATWTVKQDVPAAGTATRVTGLTNGLEYVCRAFASTTTGTSDASAVSDAFRPCGGLFDCNPLALPLLGGLAAVLAIGLLLAFTGLFRSRTTGYVIAVVDVVHTANIGHGRDLGIAFLRAPRTEAVTGIVAEKGKGAEIRIRRRRAGGFIVRDADGRKEVEDGEQLAVTDSKGLRHSLVLRAFATNAASQVATRR